LLRPGIKEEDIRQKMMEIMQTSIQKSNLKDLVKVLISGDIGK